MKLFFDNTLVWKNIMELIMFLILQTQDIVGILKHDYYKIIKYFVLKNIIYIWNLFNTNS